MPPTKTASTNLQETFSKYLDGRVLYGDDFLPDEIESWFRDEKEAYYNLGYERQVSDYGYHALNWHHGYRHLPPGPFKHVLGIGSAFAEELKPVLSHAKKVTILEPSDGFHHPQFEYIKPNPSGQMVFADNTFDLITCFGVLHHIPNVSKVINEISRCLMPGGWLLLREPTHSMGNWDLPRPGLTRRERGIPLRIMERIIDDAGLQIIRERRCMFSLTGRLQRFLPKSQAVYNTRWITVLDDYLCNIPIWSKRYHPDNFVQRFRPWAAFFVLRKPLPGEK